MSLAPSSSNACAVKANDLQANGGYWPVSWPTEWCRQAGTGWRPSRVLPSDRGTVVHCESVLLCVIDVSKRVVCEIRIFVTNIIGLFLCRHRPLTDRYIYCLESPVFLRCYCLHFELFTSVVRWLDTIRCVVTWCVNHVLLSVAVCYISL